MFTYRVSGQKWMEVKPNIKPQLCPQCLGQLLGTVHYQKENNLPLADRGYMCRGGCKA